MDITLESLDTLDFSKVKCGIKTLQGYVSAICDLYTFQSQFQNNCHPHPRSAQVKKLIESVKKINLKEKDEQFHDRLKDTALDTIALSEYMRNATFLGLNDKVSESCSIANRLDLLLLYSLMARSQITRKLRLSEVGVEVVSTIYEATVRAVRFTLNNCKTNQFERVLSVGVMR
jgi:hypothetical protein